MTNKGSVPDFEDQSQVNALEEFAPRIRAILRDYRSRRQLSAIAKKFGLHSARLSEMIIRGPDGRYKKRITPYYLARFIDGGIMSVRQILQDSRLEDLPDRPRIFFERVVLSRETLSLVIEAQGRGIDVDRALREMLDSD